MKTPGEKPFALEMWGCVIISIAAVRGRRRRQEVTQHARKNRTSVDSVRRCAPGLAGPPLPSKPKEVKTKPPLAGEGGVRGGAWATPVRAENTRKACQRPQEKPSRKWGRMQDVPPTREASKDLRFWPTLEQQQLPFQQNEIFTGAFLKLI